MFQTKIEEMEQQLWTTDSLARTSSIRGGRVKGNVPEPHASRLGPLAMETWATSRVAPSSDVRERLGIAHPPRSQPIESRLGRPIDQSQTSSQTVARTSNPPATAPASAGSPSTNATPSEEIEPNSVMLWNRPYPRGWGQYKTDMLANLNMNTLACPADARKMMGGEGPTVSGLYRISGVDWLLAEQEQLSSATTLRIVDLEELPQDKTFGPLKTRSLTDVRRRASELTPPPRKSKILTENKPNNKHHKMYRQFSKPTG